MQVQEYCFNRNMTNSIARNNIVDIEDNAVFVSQLHYNQIYNDLVSNSTNGINIGSGSSDNKVYENTIIRASSHGITVSCRDAAANRLSRNHGILY